MVPQQRAASITAIALLSMLSLSSCSPRETQPVTGSVTTLRIPEKNDEYMPRDIQLELSIPDEYLTVIPNWPSTIPMNGLPLFLDSRSMRPTRLGLADGPYAINAYMQIVPQDALAIGLDTARKDFSSYKMFAHSPIIGRQFGLARRVNRWRGDESSPVDELLTKEDGKFDFVIDCQDHGQPRHRFCSMKYLTRPAGALSSSKFALETSVNFHRSRLPDWREIRAKVEAFVNQHSEIVEFR